MEITRIKEKKSLHTFKDSTKAKAAPTLPMGKSNSHQLRKKKTKPEKSTVQIFGQVIFSSFTPFVPRQDKARKTTQKSFVQRMDENKPVVRWKFIRILSMMSSVKPQT